MKTSNWFSCLLVASLSILFACQNGEKDNEAIENLFKKGVRHSMTAAELLGNGNVGDADKEYRQSVETFKQVVEMDSVHLGALGGLGHSYFQLGEYEQAIEQLRKAINIDPDFPENHRLLGLSLINYGNLLEGGKELQYAHQLNPDKSYFNTTMRDLAGIGRSSFEKGLRLDNTMGKNAGRSYQHFAIGVYMLAHDLDPSDRKIMEAIVEMCNKIGDTTTATVFEKKLADGELK